MTAIGAGEPAEEDVRGRLHQALTHHDALPVVRISAGARIGLEHRVHRLLDLQEQRMVRGRHEQGDPAAAPDAADAYDLDRGVHQTVAIEQRAPFLGQRLAIAGEDLLRDSIGNPARAPPRDGRSAAARP